MSEEGEYHGEIFFDFSESVSEEPKSLTKDEASMCLHSVGPTFRIIDENYSYCSSSYAYLCMDVSGRSLTDIDAVLEFPHVIHINLSNNRLTYDSLLKVLPEMEHLLALILDNNRIQTACLPPCSMIQILSLKQNNISSCEVNYHPNLMFLELCDNHITTLDTKLWDSEKLPEIRELGLRNNGLHSMHGICFPTLVSLFLADNDLIKVEGLEYLPNLKFLHLRNNPLRNLDGFSRNNCKLFYINIRNCLIQNVRELEKLAVLPSLRRLIVMENPFTEQEYRLNALALLPNLRKLDKTLVDKNEIKKAKRIQEQMKKEIDDSNTEMDDISAL